jgi:tRNA-specific 2-thiouridylase
MPGPTVLVAMSGGVDSSVAACLLHEQGFRVVGTHLRLVHGEGMDHGCCGPTAEADAAEVARLAGFPFEVVDLSDEFERTVVPDYVDEHRAGRTPNPCVRCNQWIKFGALLDRAERHGVDLVATGHYVRTWRDDGGVWHLGPGADPDKDQSYLLHTLGQRELARSTFPLGGLAKTETRAHAVRLGLPVAEKPDSQDLCFAPSADHGAFLVERAPDLVRPGEVVDSSGRVLGAHDGTFRFTVGQRRGLGVSTGQRLFVLETDASTARVVVGPAELLSRRGLRASDMRWVAGRPPPGAVEAEVRIRYRGAAIPAVVAPVDVDRMAVEFRRPERGVAPGQSAVVYADGEVLGGGRIDAAA